MAYKHILIAVDLSPESKVLVEKAVSMARPYNAKVSLIHVDVNYSDLYTGLIDVNLGDMQKRISEETHHALTELHQRGLPDHRDPERQRRPRPGAGRCD
jgi:universal stress protein A